MDVNPKQLFNTAVAIKGTADAVKLLEPKNGEEIHKHMMQGYNLLMDILYDLSLSGECIIEADRKEVIKTLLDLPNHGSSER